ncbi:MAG: hypothetical protein ACI4XM_00960 [Candidatus Coprovivens sp.]
MKKIIFFILSLFCLLSISYAKENDPLNLVSVVNKCSVIDNNAIVVPVKVISKNDGTLTTLIEEYTLGYIDNLKDDVNIRLTNIEGVSNVKIDNNRDSNGRSLIRYYIEENLSAKKLDDVFSFNIQIEFLDNVPDTYYILGTEVIISDQDICERVNGYQVNEVEKIEYVDLSKVDHADVVNELIMKFVIGLLIIIIILIFLLIRKKK